jgi:hypothetical protein
VDEGNQTRQSRSKKAEKLKFIAGKNTRKFAEKIKPLKAE